MKRAKSTSEIAEVKKGRASCAVKTWVKQDKHGADLCNTMVAEMGKTHERG